MQRINFDKTAKREAFRRLSVPLNFSVEDGEGGKKLKGYAAVWDVLSGDRGGYYAVFPQGSMVLPDYPVTFQLNHNSDFLIATEANGTLTLSVDATGLAIEAQLDDTYIDTYLATKVARRTIAGMSLGMYALKLHREKYVVT